jgi:hypothetical protein
MISHESSKTLTEFAAAVEKTAAHNDDAKLWYRGSPRRTNYKLVPGLFRRNDISTFEEFHKIEKQIIADFRHRSPPFSDKVPVDNLELLFLMQHFGVPTRLLDWTENPFVGLFFAVMQGADGLADDEEAAVWAINPKKLNEFSLKHVSHKGGAIQISDPSARGYRPESDEINAEPIAIFGVHNSSRIVAQRGVFVIFGQNLFSLDENPELIDTGALSIIIIPKDARGNLRQGLRSIGLTDSTVFPDLDGLAREIRRLHGY